MSSDSMPSIFLHIKEQIMKQYSRPNILQIAIKYLSKPNSLLIYLTFLQATDLNMTDEDIIFSITLSNLFPDEAPYVSCLTNFTFPTLFDNRNLLRKIINHNWTYNKFNLPFPPIEEIILQIPSFLKRISQDFNSRTLSLYGSYYINSIYDINLFNANEEEHVSLFKISQYVNQKKMLAFLVVTDINMLLFHPYKEIKLNQCKLIFSGEIRKMGNYILGMQNEEKTILLKWEKQTNKSVFSIEFSFCSFSIEDFMNIVSDKVKMLNLSYDVFEDSELDDDISVLSKSKDITKIIEKYKELIKSKEALYAKNKTGYLLNELSSLYEKMVELLSSNDNSDFEIYLEKIKQLLGEEINEEINTRHLFETSQSYVVPKTETEKK